MHLDPGALRSGSGTTRTAACVRHCPTLSSPRRRVTTRQPPPRHLCGRPMHGDARSTAVDRTATREPTPRGRACRRSPSRLAGTGVAAGGRRRPRRRCGCRCASRSAGRPAGRSGPRARSPATAGSRARRPAPTGSRGRRPAELTTWAGDSALPTKVAGSSAQSMMSIFSPCSSATTLRTRCPIGPMQAPLALSPATDDRTAILLRWPASRATATISTLPSAISGTSSANSFLTRPGWVRLSVTCGPRRPRGDADDVALEPGAVRVLLARHLLGARAAAPRSCRCRRSPARAGPPARRPARRR